MLKHSKYEFSLGIWLKAGIQSVGITAGVAVLFYQSAWTFLLYPMFWMFRYKQLLQETEDKRIAALEEQFMHGMETLNSALQAGLSMENAWREVQKEALLMYGDGAEFYQRIKDMNNSVELNMPIEKLFLEFAYSSGLEDAISFAEIFHYGKRCGGNWKQMIDRVIHQMKERYEARKEIAVMVAEKKMEQRIMNLMPLGILAFLQFSAGDYMEVLYHNGIGVLCMSVCLAAYIAAITISERILQIKV